MTLQAQVEEAGVHDLHEGLRKPIDIAGRGEKPLSDETQSCHLLEQMASLMVG